MDAFFDWLATLDPVFAFLLATPFVVAAAAFAGNAVRALRERPHVEREPQLMLDTRYKRRVLGL